MTHQGKRDWQFTILFCVGVGGTVFLAFAPAIPFFSHIPDNPLTIGGIGIILAYVLQQKTVRDEVARKREEDLRKTRGVREKEDTDGNTSGVT